MTISQQMQDEAFVGRTTHSLLTSILMSIKASADHTSFTDTVVVTVVLKTENLHSHLFKPKDDIYEQQPLEEKKQSFCTRHW